MSKPIVIGNGSIVIEREQITDAIWSELGELARERALPAVGEHHFDWWLSVGINHHRAEIIKLCEDPGFYTLASASTRIRYAVREGIVLKPDTLYIQQWLEHEYPDKRNLSMISYSHALKAARELCVDEIAGTIVYKDSRLVTSFVSKAEILGKIKAGVDEVIPSRLQKMERKYDLRRVLTRRLAKHVGDLFKNCLRDSDADYWKEDSVVGKHLFIVTEHNSTHVVGVFHTSSRVTDWLSKQVYVRTSIPLTTDNNELKIDLPETFVMGNVTFITNLDLYETAADRAYARREGAPQPATRIPPPYNPYTVSMGNGNAPLGDFAREMAQGVAQGARDEFLSRGGFRRGELMTIGGPNTASTGCIPGAWLPGPASEQEQPAVVDTEARTDTMRRFLDRWRERALAHRRTADGVSIRLHSHQRDAMEQLLNQTIVAPRFFNGMESSVGGIQSIARIARGRPVGQPVRFHITYDYGPGRSMAILDPMSQLYGMESYTALETEAESRVSPSKAQHVVERDANFFKRQKPAEKKASGLLAKLTMRV